MDPLASAKPISVVLFTDVRLYSDWLAETLVCHEGIRSVAIASELSIALSRVEEDRPQVITLDVTTARRYQAVPAFRELDPELQLVAFGVPETEAEILACAEMGLDGYVARDGTVEDLVKAIVGACRGELHCSPRVAATIFRRLSKLTALRTDAASAVPLTRRELQIAVLLEQGLSNKEIARRISIQHATVKNHVHNILEKLQVRRRGEAAARLRGQLQ